jgi:hypothetical protein
MTRHYWILLIIGAVPLLVYPFILIANIMSFAGTQGSAPVSASQWIMSKAFLWSATLYPVVYIGCLISAIVYSRSGDGAMAFKLAAAPLAHGGLCVLLLFGWMMTG